MKRGFQDDGINHFNIDVVSYALCIMDGCRAMRKMEQEMRDPKKAKVYRELMKEGCNSSLTSSMCKWINRM